MALRAEFARFGIATGPTLRNFGAEGDGDSTCLNDPRGSTIELRSEARAATWKP